MQSDYTLLLFQPMLVSDEICQKSKHEEVGIERQALYSQIKMLSLYSLDFHLLTREKIHLTV